MSYEIRIEDPTYINQPKGRRYMLYDLSTGQLVEWFTNKREASQALGRLLRARPAGVLVPTVGKRVMVEGVLGVYRVTHVSAEGCRVKKVGSSYPPFLVPVEGLRHA